MSSYHYSYTLDALSVKIPELEFTLSSPFPLILGVGSVAVYLFCIFVLFPAITPLAKANKQLLESFAKFHFVLLCIYSAFCCAATFYYIYTVGEIYSLNDYLCNDTPLWLRQVALTFTLSKIWEWGDTAIDIWRGKTVSQIGFLHCYHHATTFLLFLVVQNFPGAEKSGMLLNGFVHTLMYYHYAFRLPKILRPLITSAQIAQLVTVTYFWNITPQTCASKQDFPSEHFIIYLIPYALVPVYTIFFVIFFFEKYLYKDSKAPQGKKQT